MNDPIYTIIVNYNNWKDTIVCVEDLLRHSFDNNNIIVVDNGSTDNSLIILNKYISNQLEEEDINYLIPKWNERDKNVTNFRDKVLVIPTSVNGGFSYGNNIGIKKAIELSHGKCFIWLLNNDTVVDKEALTNLKKYFVSENYGLVGSKILNFEPPHEVQSLYGSFNKYTGRVIVKKEFGKRISYPIGASIFTNSKIIKEIGYMDEDYFLYFEELDMSTKVKKLGYKIGIAEKSIVYHHQGASTKSDEKQKRMNPKTEIYKYKGIKLFYDKNFPRLKYAAYLFLLMKGIKFFIKMDMKNMLLVFRSL
ncbi:glycosyltransferase family 2 protein [Zhouia amylolytica]|uniref:Glycosyltransferase 2-like domain-containing protein n=1 Tax=Zhouia amylolytica AD3 TaxID=1286632 RepID=W2UP83_9FLAO|nr:glycosyltransferase family 2 protein [Zhouia amylolytica]ETN95793.1 hypothetical protein P278_15150 [Zhouia amylolytica AD3]